MAENNAQQQEENWFRDAQKFVWDLLGIGKSDGVSLQTKAALREALGPEAVVKAAIGAESAKAAPAPAPREYTAAEAARIRAEQEAAKAEMLKEAARRKAEEEAALRIRIAANNRPMMTPYDPNTAPRRTKPKEFNQW